MDSDPTGPAIIAAVQRGLPWLVLQFLVTVALLVIGIGIYMSITGFRERELVRRGNVAAGIVLAGAVISLAIPLAALLATTGFVVDIVVWGIVALIIQLVTLWVITRMLRGFSSMIEAGNVAAATTLAAAQIAVALLNAAALIPV